MPEFNYSIIRLPDYQMPSAVLLSGGLDSAVLLADEAVRGEVQPIYVSVGLAWEAAEQSVVRRFLASAPFRKPVRPLARLSIDMRDVYAANHWAVEGRPPAYHTPDEDVYLPGRNIVLLSKAGVYCAAARIGRLAIGTLEHNPFPDATPEFRDAMQRALSLGLAHELRLDAPLAGTSKADVIRRGAALGVPFDLTLSCMNPQRRGRSTDDYLHCGECSKCRERHDAFLEAGVPDTTVYASAEHVR
jgi:7-cyano-7-deazaguanine synthase